MGDKPPPPGTFSSRINGRSKWFVAPLTIEWLTEWVVYWLSRWALIELIQLLGGLSIIWAGIYYMLSANERTQAAADQRKAKHFQAWQIINAANKASGEGGRLEALEDLASDSIPLGNLDLSGVDLSHFKITNGGFVGGNLTGVKLDDSCLAGTFISQTNLDKATFRHSDLSNTYIFEASLKGANMRGTVFRGTIFRRADLRGIMTNGTFQGVVSLRDTNVYGGADASTSWSPDFYQTAIDKGAVCISDDHGWKVYNQLLDRGDPDLPSFKPSDCTGPWNLEPYTREDEISGAPCTHEYLPFDR
ncbi:hypothetical protein GCM10007874_58800 [Labrys miyagiensis]|uniref:Pentapeptide repeat-containing protein n=1 Tax=Labrys miyagiensis TaxID=346912 RepID=A0ABQ6CSW3_9HYPH|nr:pentapeptide repeat-containing protein [Labrys miyagiensis]GLS22860.1 hypothetical protein GCM10007874_58800 [Labrys miyagiensis]